MRPFCIVTIATILGIIMGLYLKSMVLFILLLIIALCFFILLNKLNHNLFNKYFKFICIFIIFLLCFYLYTFYLENKHSTINEKYANKQVEIEAIIVSDKLEKEYKDVYKIEVICIKLNEEIEDIENLEVNKKKEQKFKMILNVKKDKKSSQLLQFGDKISFFATYEEPLKARNEAGFNYAQYLKTKGIIGTTSINISNLKIIEHKQMPIISKIIYNIKKTSIERIKSILTDDTANLCTSLLLGEKSELSDEIKEDFKKSNLTHMLAISGAHVSYILLGITAIIQRIGLHKRWSKILLIIFLLFFMALVGFTPSVSRACIMAIYTILASILFKKADTYQNLAISSFIILLINPYSILDIGFQLSYAGTIGIVVLSKNLFSNKNTNSNEFDCNNSKEIKRLDINTNGLTNSNLTIRYLKNILAQKDLLKKLVIKIREMCVITLSANLLILPIIVYHFNTISFTFLISNLLASPILGISLVLAMPFIVALFIFKPIATFVSFILRPILNTLITIANFSCKLPFSQILVPTPKIWQIILYYIILFFILWCKYKREDMQSIKFNYSKSKFDQILNYKKIIIWILIIILIIPYAITFIPTNKVIINFIDVGQGDCMLIQTPSKKTILVDGGGTETGSFDVGERILLPYLLDKGILKIDYMIFSHFDSDHCKRIIYNNGKIKGKVCSYKQTRRKFT